MCFQILVVYILATLALSSPTPKEDSTAALFRNILGDERRDMEPRKYPAESLVPSTFEYSGNSRRIAGCSAVVIDAKWTLMPSACIAGRIVVRKTTVGNVPLKAVHTLGHLAALELQRPIKKTVAKLASKVPTNLVLETREGSRRYRVRDKKFCSKLGRSMKGEGKVCATPLIEESTCPVDRRSIAFETGPSSGGVVGFGIGIDCFADRKEGVSEIALVVPYAEDIKNLIDGKPSKFVKKADNR